MNFDRRSRAGIPATKKPPQIIKKKQFIQYEPELAEEFKEKKSNNQSVSGRLLTLLYKRLLFWSRYAKHQYEGRRYFWKSISELSEELSYSTKQISRGLKSLEELGMIKREKLNKHNWKHTYYYYLPKSVHTAEPEASTATRTTSSNGTRLGSSNSTFGGSEPAGTTLPQSSTHSTQTTHQSTHSTTRTALVGTQPRSVGTGGSGGGSHRAEPLKPFRQRQSGQNVSFISRKNNPLLENQLRQIVEKCLDYGINPPKTLTGGGLGFST
jgi:DNA-binding MarR family transcriptional regulator